MSGGKLSPKFLTVSVFVSITYLVRPEAPPVVAASLVSSLQVAAVAPSHEGPISTGGAHTAERRLRPSEALGRATLT